MAENLKQTEKITKQIFTDYFTFRYGENSERERKTRGQVDRKELYEYQDKLDKSAFDMNAEELLEMVSTYRSGRGDNWSNVPITPSTYTQISSIYRDMWAWYSEEVHPIRNPWNKAEMKGQRAIARITKGNRKFTAEIFDDAIKELRKSDPEGCISGYVECVLLLFRCGISSVNEIVILREDMIDFENKTITFPYKVVHITDRVVELLKKIHDMETIVAYRITSLCVPYRGSYFKFIVRKKEADDFESKPIGDAERCLRVRVTKAMAKIGMPEVNVDSAYNLGFYEYMVSQAGKEHIDSIVTAFRDNEGNEEIMRYAKEYGNNAVQVNNIRNAMRMFV